MADDDYGKEIPLNIPEAESQLDASESQDPPKDPTTTETPPTTGADDNTATGDTHDDAEYTKQLQNQYETDIKRADAHAHDQQQYIDSIQKQQADIANTPKPQLQQIPPASQDQKGQLTSRVFQVLSIAAVAFSLFGKRRNGYAQGALMGGIGALINGYVQGNAEKHKQDTANWHKLNEDIHKENGERLQDYKDILANKKLNMEQQMKLMEMKGKFYESNRMEMNGQKQDVAAIHKHVTDMKKYQDNHNQNTPMPKADAEMYNGLIQEKSGGKYDMSTPEGRKWAMENYPRSQFYNDKKDPVRTDKKTGEKSGGFYPKKVDPKSDDPLNLGIHKPKPGESTTGQTGYTGPDGKPYTPKSDDSKDSPSVLGSGDSGGW